MHNAPRLGLARPLDTEIEMSKTTQVFGSVYDYPSYYDVLFNSSWKREWDFLIRSARNHAKVPVRRIFEPACGTGRLLWRLAKTGFQVEGLDLNPKAVGFCNRRMRRHGLKESAKIGDMSKDLLLDHPVELVFNFVSSFCHLLEQSQAEQHLRLVSRSLVPGGIYLLGFHLKPRGKAECDREQWSVRKGNLALTTDLQTTHWDRKARREKIEFRIQARTPGKTVNLVDRFDFRTYTKDQFLALLKRTDSLEIAAIYDFSFEPIPLNHESEDVVFVLRKK